MVRSTKRDSNQKDDNLNISTASLRRSRRSFHNSTLDSETFKSDSPLHGEHFSSPGKHTPRRSARTHNQITYYPKDAVVAKRSKRRKTKKTKVRKQVRSSKSPSVLNEKSEEECSDDDISLNLSSTVFKESCNSPKITNDVIDKINANTSVKEVNDANEVALVVDTPAKSVNVDLSNISTLAVLGSAKCDNPDTWDFPEYEEGVCDTPLSSLKRTKTDNNSRITLSSLFRNSAKDSIAKRRQRALINRLITPNSYDVLTPELDLESNKTVQSIQVETKTVHLTFQMHSNVVETKAQQSVTTFKRKRSFGTDRSDNEENVLKATETRITRRKMPNFSAIHQQNFDKMESIFDHVNKKQERAKQFLTTDINGTQAIKQTTNALKQTQVTPKALPPPKFEFSKIPVFTKSINNAERVVHFTATPQKLQNVEDKVTKRRERNMAIFKNGPSRVIRRQQVTDRTEFIHGVRSNRRFALQMKYRDENYK